VQTHIVTSQIAMVCKCQNFELGAKGRGDLAGFSKILPHHQTPGRGSHGYQDSQSGPPALEILQQEQHPWDQVEHGKRDTHQDDQQTSHENAALSNTRYVFLIYGI